MKLYADEEGHEAVRALEAPAVSALVRVEVPAAIWRKHRIGELSGPDAGVLARAFEADFHGSKGAPGRFAVVAVASGVLDRAAALCAVHGLRAYDAVQLASAVATRVADPSCTALACFDGDLRDAAAAEGFEPVP